MRYTCVDTFSGAGGLSLGLSQAGFEIILAIDHDPVSVRTMKMNPAYFDHAVLEADIAGMRGGRLLQMAKMSRGELFLLAGGPPCQGFSVQRIGEDEDERNELVHVFVDLIGELAPRYFLMENVPGIRGKRGRQVFDDAVRVAERHGYYTHSAVLDAQDFGVPQRRRRMFVVGERMDLGWPTYVFPKADPQVQRATVREAIGHLPEPPADGSDHPDHPHHRRDRLSEKNLLRLRALSPGQGMEHLPDELVADCHRVGADVIGHRNVYGRMEWDSVAPTITARFDSFTRGQFGHPEQDRSISLREGALLQSFPKDFLFAGSKVEVARQIGNAVPPMLARAMGQSLIQCDRAKNESGV